ncbi:unnamed protein product [Brassicogethes aeneus]|uniref:MATH domain-containing protein n=1 Tax=Brassicogethes aeneus TaxID=1431903 RepID=A0A9P0BCJ9_BRAAE|nr:unnamed protein product [Brassicogethes aeneus]
MDNFFTTKSKMPFTCYFCNKVIENETQEGHTTVCSKILQPCPYKCGSYVARCDMPRHKSGCINQSQKSMPKSRSNANLDLLGPMSLPTTLDRNYGRNIVITNAEVHESRERHNSYNSVELPPMKSFDKLVNAFKQFGAELSQVKHQNRGFSQWKADTEMLLNKLQDSFAFYQSSKSNSDATLYNVQEKLKFLDVLQMNMNILRDNIVRDQNYTRNLTDNLTKKFEEQIANIMTIINLHKDDNLEVKENIDSLKSSVDEVRSKLTNVLFDLRATSQIASGTEEKIEIMERENSLLRKEIEVLKGDVENLSSTQDKEFTVGRLLWKVSNVKSKLQTSKETNYYYKSPIFYSHEYGYKIRLVLYLNGLKKWRDRNTLISLEVLKGDYDSLLKWPCQIEGNIILRDQENLDTPKNVVKQILTRLEGPGDEADEPQESSSSFVFITHAVLFQEKYTKDDTIFLDVVINQLK